jgi:hypothetical protein
VRFPSLRSAVPSTVSFGRGRRSIPIWSRNAFGLTKGILPKLQCILLRAGVAAETRFFNKLFGLYTASLSWSICDKAPFCALLAVIFGAPGAWGSNVLPDGLGKQQTERICSQCHGIDVAIGSRRSREGWRRTILDMVARGAQGTPQELDVIATYLATHFGTSAPDTEAAPATAGPRTEQKSKLAVMDFPVSAKVPAEDQWRSYGYDAAGARFSPLTQISPANVSKLQRAWTFHLQAVSIRR